MLHNGMTRLYASSSKLLLGFVKSLLHCTPLALRTTLLYMYVVQTSWSARTRPHKPRIRPRDFVRY